MVMATITARVVVNFILDESGVRGSCAVELIKKSRWICQMEDPFIRFYSKGNDHDGLRNGSWHESFSEKYTCRRYLSFREASVLGMIILLDPTAGQS